LIIRSDQRGLSDEDINSFYKTGVNTSAAHIFIFYDIARDPRLRNDLRVRHGDNKLYTKIKESIPAFVFCSKRIQDVSDASGVEILAIKNYATDVDYIHKKIGLASASTRGAILRALKTINSYSGIRPGMLGITINVNQMISDLIDWLEKRQP
jgi:hypothetical protein